MAITLEEIAKYLEAEEFKYELNTEREVLLAGIGNEGQSASLFIRMKERGEMFSLDMEPLKDDLSGHFDIPVEHPHLLVLLQQLLYANYETKFGAWEYDPKDGDLKFTIEFPVEDGTITAKQFHRILGGAFTALDSQAKFKKILETGEVPKEESRGAKALAELETLLKQMKAEASQTSSDDSDGI